MGRRRLVTSISEDKPDVRIKLMVARIQGGFNMQIGRSYVLWPSLDGINCDRYKGTETMCGLVLKGGGWADKLGRRIFMWVDSFSGTLQWHYQGPPLSKAWI